MHKSFLMARPILSFDAPKPMSSQAESTPLVDRALQGWPSSLLAESWSRCRTSSSRESRRGVKQLFTSPSPRPRRLEGVTVGAKKTLSGGARRLSSASLIRFLQRLQRARRVRENRGDRRQKEEKVGGGGGGVGERVVVDPRHRDRVRGRRRWEEVVVGVGV